MVNRAVNRPVNRAVNITLNIVPNIAPNIALNIGGDWEAFWRRSLEPLRGAKVDNSHMDYAGPD